MSNLNPELHAVIAQNVATALAEDLGSGDLTAQLIADTPGRARVVCRSSAILCGVFWFEACFTQLSKHISITWKVAEGAAISPGQTLCELQGNSGTILSAERTALNFLQTLSATATQTRAYVEAIRGLPTVIMDTRKTLPGLRLAQKYAVRIGGGQNQRVGLYDGVLIKENHIAAAGGIAKILALARRTYHSTIPIQIEVETLDELTEALDNDATLILLDNFSLDDLIAAVRLGEKRALLEASGGVNLKTVRAIAATGVDRISIGRLTKDVSAVDLSLLLDA